VLLSGEKWKKLLNCGDLKDSNPTNFFQ